MDVSDRQSGTGAASRPGILGRKIPWEAVVGLVLVVVAAFALLRPSNSEKSGSEKTNAGSSQEKAAVETGEIEIDVVAGSGQKTGATSADDVAAELRVASQPRVRIKPDDVAVFMRAKLDHAQHVIEGLAMEDYQAIYRAAHDLALASQASAWEVLLTEEYARQSADFRRSCEALRAAARDENLDAAALAWMEVTMKCVQCHKYVRQADGEER